MTGNQDGKKDNSIRTTIIHILKLADKNFKVTDNMLKNIEEKIDKMNLKIEIVYF